MAKRTLTNPHGLPEVYSQRQPRRPHYLREWMERRNIKSQAELVKELGADKGLVSRWLDEHNPSTPGKEWQEKLGAFFGGDGDPVDIFRHPDDDWFRRFFQGRDRDEIERIKQTMETGFPKEKRARK